MLTQLQAVKPGGTGCEEIGCVTVVTKPLGDLKVSVITPDVAGAVNEYWTATPVGDNEFATGEPPTTVADSPGVPVAETIVPAGIGLNATGLLSLAMNPIVPVGRPVYRSVEPTGRYAFRRGVPSAAYAASLVFGAPKLSLVNSTPAGQAVAAAAPAGQESPHTGRALDVDRTVCRRRRT